MTELTNSGDIKALIEQGSAGDLKAILDQLSPAELKNLLARLDPADFPGLLAKVDPSVLTAIAGQIGTPGELRRILDLSGGDDALIEQFFTKAGAEALLDRVFALMGTRFLADKVGGETGVVQWHVTTPDGTQAYQLTIADGRAVGQRGAAAQPRTTLTMAAPDLLRLCAGKVDGITLFMNGKIKLAGDMLFGAKLPTAFDTTD